MVGKLFAFYHSSFGDHGTGLDSTRLDSTRIGWAKYGMANGVFRVFPGATAGLVDSFVYWTIRFAELTMMMTMNTTPIWRAYGWMERWID
jgi:hypothetical protein